MERVAIDFNKPTQRWLARLPLAEAKRHYSDEQFDRGSMGPKIKAVIDYLEAGGKAGLITSPDQIGRALKGETGTLIVPD